ncbi:hypothetical protein [Marivirga harenae]|uniref:hypothetical protein n=1 Tax=Marivirga harenae TaxID=2010992 RepID=UPI0026DF743B|nr:hypothetical protein [Marivirga harenae]WKV11452.1 hypothetical protein Q3Y49_14695 [Marivirga harenae]
MIKCCICQTSDADKLGSHVVPAFMLVSMIGKRNEEVGFQISSRGFVQKYIGREVSPESINKLLDRELTDEDIENNENLFTVDNLVCTVCENRLGAIESICAPFIKSIQKPEENEEEIESIYIEQNLELRLLFLTILYRLGSAEKFDYNLNITLKRRIRNILAKVLDTDPKVINENLLRFKSEIISMPMAVFYCPLSEENSTSNQIYCHNETSIPAIAMINEFIITVYNNKSQTSFDFSEVYSLDKSMVVSVINYKENNFKIGTAVDRKKVNKSMNDELAKVMCNNLSTLYRQISEQHKGVNPSADELKAFMDELIFDETPETDKYTPGNIARVMHKHLVP